MTIRDVAAGPLERTADRTTDRSSDRSSEQPGLRLRDGGVLPPRQPEKPKTLEQIAEERRKSKRDTLVTAALARPANSPADIEGVRVFIANISMHGVAFRCRDRFDKGSMHYVKLMAGPLKLEALVRIQWCRQRNDGTFDVGSQFMETPGVPSDAPRRSA
jgi:hypothetical protein